MSEWIVAGTPRGGRVALVVEAPHFGEVFIWSCRGFAAKFGRRTENHWQLGDIDLRTCAAHWIDESGGPANDDALEGASLLSSTGVSISLARATQLLGLESPEAFVETPSAPAAPARASNTNGVPADGFYSSRKGAPHLPGKSRRWMLDHAREIPGASKVGRDWVIPHAAYERWRAEQDAARCRATASIRTPDADARTIAERTLANAGLRPTREC
jgi:hypothetical protein